VTSYKIALVEDDPAIQQMYRFKFESEGFEVAVAGNGEDGLRIARHFKPALLLLDIRMPRMNGDEMLQELRAEAWGAAIRVIVLTNLSKDEAPSVLRFLNVERYIVKAHHTPAQVVAIVKEVLGIKS